MSITRNSANPLIAAHFRKQREYHGLSVVELAKRSGVTNGTIYRIERSQRGVSLEMACRIAEGLGVPLRDFLANLKWREE